MKRPVCIVVQVASPIPDHFRNQNWCLPYVSIRFLQGLNFREYAWFYMYSMVHYLHVRVLEFPLNGYPQEKSEVYIILYIHILYPHHLVLYWETIDFPLEDCFVFLL